jgi:hypothetical protein
MVCDEGMAVLFAALSGDVRLSDVCVSLLVRLTSRLVLCIANACSSARVMVLLCIVFSIGDDDELVVCLSLLFACSSYRFFVDVSFAG